MPLARRETDTDGCLLSTDGIEPRKFNRERCDDCKCLFQQTQTPCEQGAWVFPLLSCRGERRLCGGLCCSWQPGMPHPLTVYALWRLDTAGHCAEHPPCRVTLWSRTNPKPGLGSNIGGAGREWIGKGAGGAGGKGGVRSLQYIWGSNIQTSYRRDSMTMSTQRPEPFTQVPLHRPPPPPQPSK